MLFGLEQEALSWIQLRNQAVHTAKPVTRSEAKALVEGVESIVGKLQM